MRPSVKAKKDPTTSILSSRRYSQSRDDTLNSLSATQSSSARACELEAHAQLHNTGFSCGQTNTRA